VRTALILISFFCFHYGVAQDDFFKVYEKILKARTRENVILENDKEVVRKILRDNRGDTVAMKEALRSFYSRSLQFRSDSVMAYTNQVMNLTFPDINFSGFQDKTYSVSDCEGRSVIISYNYMYCETCFYRVDTTLAHLKSNQALVIALFSDIFQKEKTEFKIYGNNVLVGFVNDDTRDLISLTMGDNFMYYLNENRQVVFFDRTAQNNPELAWIDFLKIVSK
jgi:hypothetical protein